MVSHRSSMLFLAKGREEIIQKKGKDLTRVMAQTEEAFTGFCNMKLLGVLLLHHPPPGLEAISLQNMHAISNLVFELLMQKGRGVYHK